MNRIRGGSTIVLAILVFAEAVLFPGPCRSQGFLDGAFKLSQDVRWGDAVLPMGDYEYFVESNRWPPVVRVQQSDGNFSGVFTPQSFVRRDPGGNSGIVLASEGNVAYVTSIILPSLGGELVFPVPSVPREKQPEGSAFAEETRDSAVLTLEHFSILNPNRERLSPQEAERVYLGVCEAIQKEFNRPAPFRPPLTLRLGAHENVLSYQAREIQLKKWDRYRFADAVVDLALYDLVPRDERVRLSNSAVAKAGATVAVCELKACVK